jgi:sn-glycerol 3-phosphate transport system ATP-binding protein
VRPEEVGAAPAGNGTGLAFDADFAEELGPNRLLHGVLGGEPFVISVASSASERSGAAMHLSVPPENVHLFDIETGRSLRCGS